MIQTKLNTTKSSETDVPKLKLCKLFHLSEVEWETVILVTEAIFLLCFVLICSFVLPKSTSLGCLMCRRSGISFVKQYKLPSPSSFLSCLDCRETHFQLQPNSSVWAKTAAAVTERELTWTRARCIGRDDWVLRRSPADLSQHLLRAGADRANGCETWCLSKIITLRRNLTWIPSNGTRSVWCKKGKAEEWRTCVYSSLSKGHLAAQKKNCWQVCLRWWSWDCRSYWSLKLQTT